VSEVALVAGTDSQQVGVGQVGQTGGRAEVVLTNEGDIPLTDLQARLEGSSAGDYRIDGGGLSGERLPPGETRTVTIAFRPSGQGQRVARLVATAAEGASDTTTVVGRGVRLRVEASPPARGAAAEIAVRVEGGFTPTSDTLYARRGGTTRYQPFSLTETDQEPLRLTGQVSDTLVTPRGIDYYAVLVGEAGTVTVPAGGARQARQRPRHLRVQFDSLTAPVTVPERRYRMVTVPVRPSGGTKAALEATYGSYDPQVWRLLRWEAEEGGYEEYPEIDSLRPGEAFWLITDAGEEPVFGAGQTAEAGAERRIPLRAGWNQVGSPFGYAVPWDAVQAASGLSDTAVDGPVAYRDGQYRRGPSRLEAWRGYFVFSAEQDTLVVPPVGSDGTELSQSSRPAALAKTGRVGAPANGYRPLGRTGDGGGRKEKGDRQLPEREQTGTPSPSGNEQAVEAPGNGDMEAGVQRQRAQTDAPKKASQKEAAEEVPYTVKVETRVGDRHPSQVWLGLRSEAKAGRDHLDFAQAPPIGSGVRLSVPEQVAGRSVPHAGSFKPTGEAGRSWRLRLNNPSDTERDVQIGVQSAGGLPPGQSRYLLDLGEDRRMAPGQTLTVGAGEQRALKVIVGTKAYAESESGGIGLDAFTNKLRGNYPNPFGEETTIGYTLAEKQDVTVEIYNVLGQRVHTLVSEKKQRAGLHRVQWTAENRYGEPVGSGVYFVRIRAEGFTQTKKMVLVR
ncbi:MAG TPA: T9SS type A sorting domain-containing protein, partial [Salinibacter sp.]|nr:T9SS type A sorting domain-containing protein [Salinibacter sp.]